MIKKIIAAALSIALCLSLAGCIIDLSALPEFPTKENTSPSPAPEAVPEITPEPAAVPEPTAEPEPAEETPAPDEQIYIEPPEPDPVGSWLYGSWYGWWIITEADGDCADYAGRWSDVLMQAEYNGEDETAEISLADENGKLGNIVARAMNEELFSGVSGSFFETEIENGSWQISRNAYGCEDFVVLKNISVSTENGSFTYSVYLKPWGSTWEDVAGIAADNDGVYSDMMPYRYEQYLSMIDSMQAVPDSFKNFG